jgi:hypothetical protein
MRAPLAAIVLAAALMQACASLGAPSRVVRFPSLDATPLDGYLFAPSGGGRHRRLVDAARRGGVG